MEPAKEALLQELRRAKIPNGTVLRALRNRSHVNFFYKSASGGQHRKPYNLPQIVMGALKVGDSCLEAAYLARMRSIRERLMDVEGLPDDFADLLKNQVDNQRDKLNAMMTVGGAVHALLSHVLACGSRCETGPGSTEKMVQNAG